MIGTNNTAMFNDESVTFVDVTKLYNSGITELSDIKNFIGTDEYFDVLPNKPIVKTAETAQNTVNAQSAITKEVKNVNVDYGE